MLIYNFADWTEWNVPQKVTFIPEEKLISIHPGETQIDVQIDLYSAWKEWIQYYDNAKWAAAFTTFGGDPTGPNQYAPRYFFLTNGWKVYVSNMSVVVQMNLYSDDGLSPFIIDNAAITNRASDVPVIKSELEQRLDYGDRVYYDETSTYTGTAYPNGTIAQPVNNPYDAIAIAQLYNINNFYCLSNVNLPGIVGQTFENYSIYADNENLTVTLYNNNYMNNIDWHNFIIDGNFYGGTNKFVDCVIVNALDVSGQFKNCQINGTIRSWDSVVISSSYDGVASYDSPIFDMNSGRTTSMSIRSYSGGVYLKNCDTTGCTAAIEITAGQVKLDSTCTSGFIDLCGVGYLVNNSSGSTVKTLGLVGEFPLTSEDVDKLASLTGLTELLVLTGMTDQLNTIESGVTLSNENIGIVNANVIIVNDEVLKITGVTEQLYIIDSGITQIDLTLTGITNDINDISIQLTGITEQLITIESGITYMSGVTTDMNSGLTEINNTLTGLTNDVKLILGLTQHNYRLSDHIYDSGQRLTSVKIKLYNSKEDCDSSTNNFATYQMNAAYDVNGLLIDYKVVKI
jgi:hypothetical protein